MAKYLLDTNAYFAILKYIVEEEHNSVMEAIVNSKCCISKLTQIEIISVIGQYARGKTGQRQVCDRIHEETGEPCGNIYVTQKRRKWSRQKVHDWLKLENEISGGVNKRFRIDVLDVNEKVIEHAERFIQNALIHNFGSMDAMILGTARAYSSENEEMIVVTADKALKAGMRRVGYPFVSININRKVF